MDYTSIIIENDFIICRERNHSFRNVLKISEFLFQYNDTEVACISKNEKTIIIHGTIVNSIDSNADEQSILRYLYDSKDFSDVIQRSKILAGRFVIIYNSADGFFVLPDATASIPVSYTIQNSLYVSSEPKLIASINSYTESSISRKIMAHTNESHALPYDLTMYDQVKYVIPNHFLDCKTQSTKRYYPIERMKSITVEEAVDSTGELLRNIINAYKRKYPLSISLTSGMDSRLILSICKEFMAEIPTFIFKHIDLHDDAGDIVVPQIISKDLGFRHIIIDDLILPVQLVEICRNRIGGNLNRDEVRNAWTYINSDLSSYWRLDGNISPLAKSSFGRDLPDFLATAFYLNIKTHNYSKENLHEIQKWRRDVKLATQGVKISKFDLFFWEHRIGKWTAKSYKNYNMLANSINPFNCRALLELWVSIPRKERLDCRIHKEVIKENWPELLYYPINPDSKHIFINKISLLFYFGSYAKYILGYRQHCKNLCNRSEF